MLNMENAEEVMQILERFTRLKQKEIPKELDDYMHYVAKTGDTVFKWSSLKYLFREKLLNVIKNFHDTSPRVDDLPQYPNVDPFNYESMKSSLLERLELFNAAPFSVQRLCELLTEPRKQYSRIDKFMRALEKNILVSTIEPGRKRSDSENGDSLDSVVNGDASLDVNVDIDMENETIFNAENQSNATSSSTPASQPSSNLIHKSDDDILPNPKKAKLDLDESTTPDAETEAATKSIIASKSESVADSSAEKTVEDSSEAGEAKKSVETVAEASAASTNEAVTTTESAEVKKDAKLPEPEKMDDDAPSSTVENNNVDKPVDASAEKIDEKEEITSSESVTIEKVSAPEVCGNEIDSTEQTEKTDEEPEGKKKDCAEQGDKTNEVDSKPNEKDIPKETKAASEAKKSEEKTENTITTTSVEKPKDKPAELAADKAVAQSSGDKVAEKITNGKETVVAVVAAAAEKPTNEDPKTPKVEVDSSSVSEDAKKTEETAPADDKAPTPAVEEIKEKKAADSTESIEKAEVAEQPKPTTESLPTEAGKASVEAQSSTDTKKVAEEPAETTSTVEPTTSEPAPIEAEPIETAVPVVVDEPAVPIDQPMEENITESIAEAEPVVPTIVVEAAAAVEEVEMATDAIEPAKDEPAGMEVDDTSQEAMDQ